MVVLLIVDQAGAGSTPVVPDIAGWSGPVLARQSHKLEVAVFKSRLCSIFILR